MDHDLKEVFPESAPAQLPEIPEEEGSETGEITTEAEEEEPSSLIERHQKKTNRRFNSSPFRRQSTDIEGNIKKVLHNVIKSKGPLRRQHLETIFEEPIKENGKVVFISLTRAKRSISFSQFVSKAKQKKRKAKAKKLLDRLEEDEARVNEVQLQFWKMDL